jgi:hypothetical protein
VAFNLSPTAMSVQWCTFGRADGEASGLSLITRVPAGGGSPSAGGDTCTAATSS